MGDKHIVRFEPVGIEIEVDEDQTVLRAAAEQGVMLMHGCKEGQCASCKSFVLDGEDLELDRYSTFALPDFEQRGGLHPALPGARLRGRDDRAAQLRRGDDPVGPPDPAGGRRGGVQRAVTHDMRHLVLKLVEPQEVEFLPGQYVDITIPDTETTPVVLDGQHVQQGERAARVRHQGLPGRPVLELPGHQAGGRRPARRGRAVRRLHPARGRDCDLVFVGGGAGMAPILCLLRSLAERGSTRKATYYYGARTTARPVLRGGAARPRGDAAQLPLRPGAVRADRGRRLGRRGRPDHRRREDGTRPTCRTSTPTSAGRPRWSRRPWRCSTGWARPRSTSTTTSSRPPATAMTEPRERPNPATGKDGP